MMTFENGSIREYDMSTATTVTLTSTAGNYGVGSVFPITDYVTNSVNYWHAYPIYVCSDKTAKAIEVLKALEADGFKVTSVPKFIALVEKIRNVL